MLHTMLFPMFVYALLLFVPGFLILLCARLPRIWALCCAPIITTGAVAILGELYAACGIAATPLSVYLPATGIPLLLLAAIQLLHRNSPSPLQQAPTTEDQPKAIGFPTIAWWIPIVFVGVGILICNNLFISELSSIDVVLQAFDNQHHLNCIQAFVDGQCISSLKVSFFLSEADAAIMPFGIASFYPAVWYGQCALFMQVLNVSAPVAINVSLATTLGIAYPLAVCAFAASIFRERRMAVVFCALACVAFVTFPWCLLLFGPLYPNLVGFVLMPATMALCMYAFQLGLSIRERITIWAIAILALVGQALLQPNTLFSMFLILVPFVAQQTYRLAQSRGLGALKSCAAAGVFLLACLAFWTACFKSPVFASVIREYWNRFAYPWQEVINILTQVYTLFYFYEITAQVMMGILVIIGCVRAFYDGKVRWLLVSYVFICFINFINATTYNDTLKRFVAGFWYTDAMRMAAIAITVAIPLAAFGLDWIYEQACHVLDGYNARLERNTHPSLVVAVMCVCFLVINFMPGFNWPGAHSELSNHIDEYRLEGHEYDSNSVKTTFGDYRQKFRDLYAFTLPIDAHEIKFLQDVKDVVGSDLVINDPYDGSALAYGIKGIRTYYRKANGYGGVSETPQSITIRTDLANITTNTEVRKAVDDIGAQYVMVLDSLYSDISFLIIRSKVTDGAFDGISSITPDTPGFTEVLSNGACHLYRID